MTKQTGTIITVIVAVITLLCCTGPLCSGGIALFTDVGTWSSDIDSIPPASGIAPCCLSILVLVVPVLCWLFLVRNKQETMGMEMDMEMEMEMEPEEEFEGTIEDDISY